jgi:hypothetical protein
VDVPPEQAEPAFTFIAHQGFSHLNTRIYVRLLGPCFKTGELKAFCQHLEEVSGWHPGADGRAQHCTSTTRDRPLRAPEPCLEAPPSMFPRSTRWYRPGYSITRRQPSIPQLFCHRRKPTDADQHVPKIPARRALHAHPVTRCKPSLLDEPYTPTDSDS